jgi:hypothetical protein
MICFSLLLLLLSSVVGQTRCGPGGINLFTTMHVVDASCQGQTAGTAASVREGSLCADCAGSCELGTRLCFRRAQVCTFRFRAPVRLDSIAVHVTLRRLRQVTAFTADGSATIAQVIVVNPASKVADNDWYLAMAVGGVAANLTAIQLQMFPTDDQPVAVSRIFLCGAPLLRTMSAPSIVTPFPVARTLVPPPPAQTPPTADNVDSSQDADSTTLVAVPEPAALSLGAVIGIGVGGGVCLLGLCVAVVLVVRARRSAKMAFTFSSRRFGSTTPRAAAPAASDDGVASIVMTEHRYDHVAEQEDVDRYNQLALAGVDFVQPRGYVHEHTDAAKVAF